MKAEMRRGRTEKHMEREGHRGRGEGGGVEIRGGNCIGSVWPYKPLKCKGGLEEAEN